MNVLTSSTFALGKVVDGIQEVVETHVDILGGQHVYPYRAAVGSDFTAFMNNRAAALQEMLPRREFDLAMQTPARPVLRFQTAAEFATRIRQAYKGALTIDCMQIAYWIVERLNAGDVTDLQLQNAFGLTANQYNTLKTTILIPQHDHWVAVLGAVGQ